MSFFTENIINILSSYNYAASSIKTLLANAKRVYKIAFPQDKRMYTLRLRNNAQVIIDSIKKLPIKQQKQYIYTILIIYKKLPSELYKDQIMQLYKNFYDNICNEHADIVTVMQPNQNQIEKNITTEQLNTVYNTFSYIDELNNEDARVLPIITINKYLMTKFYKHNVPVRPQIYINCIFEQYQQLNTGLNVYDMQNSCIIVKKAKTLKAGMTFIIPIPEIINNAIKKTYNNRIYLFSQYNGNMLTGPNFTQIFSRMFNDIIGIDITPNNIRNIFISKIIDKYGLEVSEKRKHIAKLMGHSINTQNNVYSKYSKLVHNN